MPLYEYHCAKCDADIELLIRTPQEQPVCPTCNGTKLEKLLSVPAGHVAGGKSSLPQMPMNCGKPQCGMGGCQGM